MLKCVFNELGKIANKMCVLVCVREENRKNFGLLCATKWGREKVGAWLCVRSTEIIVSHKLCVLRLNLILVGQPQCQLKRPTSQSPSINFSLVLFFFGFLFFLLFSFFPIASGFCFVVGRSEKLWQGIVPRLCILLLSLLLLSCVVCACV